MKVVLFGATGMIGQGVLRECLLDSEVEQVLSVGRTRAGQRSPKLREIVHDNFLDFSAIEREFAAYDACFFCLGISSAGMSEDAYRRVTYDFTLAAARALAKQSPGMVFVYVSGTGTDSTERGRVMWARVKGATENALRTLGFRAAYSFRPGYIQPMHGITSRTSWYRTMYAVVAPLYPLLKAIAPRYVTTTEAMGRAMLNVAKHGWPRPVLESPDINAAAERSAAIDHPPAMRGTK
jgi:uncharacterized protein YbjT (DUF2867 family)